MDPWADSGLLGVVSIGQVGTMSLGWGLQVQRAH